MLEWVSRKRREEKRQAEAEAALKESLANKVKRFQAPPEKKQANAYTEVTLNGKRIRVAREHITIEAISPLTVDNPS